MVHTTPSQPSTRPSASSNRTQAFSIRKCKFFRTGTLTHTHTQKLPLTLASIFLYFFLLACFVGVVYFFYAIWIAPYFPRKRRGGDRTKRGVAKKGAADEGV